MTIYSLDILLSRFETSLLFHICLNARNTLHSEGHLNTMMSEQAKSPWWKESWEEVLTLGSELSGGEMKAMQRPGQRPVEKVL